MVLPEGVWTKRSDDRCGQNPSFRVSGSTPTPWSGPSRDHGLNPALSTENPRNKGFSGSGAPIFGFGLADPAPKG